MRLKKIHSFFFFKIILIFLVLTSFVNVRPGFAELKQNYSQKLLETLSYELGIPVTSLQIVNETTLTLPYLNRRIPTAKMINRETGMLHEISLDESGHRINADELIAQDFAIRKDKYGKLEPELHTLLQTTKDTDTVEVAIWLAAPDEPLKRPTLEEINLKGEAIIEAEMEIQAGEKKAKISAIQKPLLEHLQTIGVEIRDINGLAPVISAKLTKGQIHVIASRSDVDGIYLSRENQPLLDFSAPTIGAPQVWGRGITGLNQRVAIIEQEGIYFGNPYLTGKGYNRLNSCIGNSPSPYHATIVAGVVVSNHSSYKGVAYGATLLGGEACSFNDSDIMAATEWARGNGGRAHNNSWGFNNHGLSGNMARYHDTIVRDWGITVVDAAGNCEGGCEVLDPALAYNVIAVGAFDDRNTPSWVDDVMWNQSSFINPFSYHMDREKPEVVAPGVNIVTTDGTWDPVWGLLGNYSGTSFAAPHVAGMAAMLVQRYDSLNWYPEAVKAIIMASAVHNIEGSSRLSPWDGAGGVSMDYADQIVSDFNKWDITYIGNAGFDGHFDQYGYMQYNFYAYAGQKVRAVIAWNTTTSLYIRYPSMPAIDLDLFVYTPGGSLVASSTSFDNTYEIVEFTATGTDYYYLKVFKHRFDQYDTYIGVAWLNYY